MEIYPLTEVIIGAAIEVHRELGPGLLEHSYEAALHHELALRGINSARQRLLPIRYKGLSIKDAYRMDLVVEELVVVEIKTVEAFKPVHSAQLLTYLRMSQLRIGLLLNFHTPTLGQGIKRMINPHAAEL
jgi:GxxExxY protein